MVVSASSVPRIVDVLKGSRAERQRGQASRGG